MKNATRVERILSDFVAQPKMKARMEALFFFAEERYRGRSRGRSGFEKWLQFELVLFLQNAGMDFGIEAQVDVNKRKKQENKLRRIDLWMRFDSGTCIDIELKVRRDLSYAIKALKFDLEELSKVREDDRVDASFAVVLCGDDIDEERRKQLEGEFCEFRVVPAGKRVNFIFAELAAKGTG